MLHPWKLTEINDSNVNFVKNLRGIRVDLFQLKEHSCHYTLYRDFQNRRLSWVSARNQSTKLIDCTAWTLEFDGPLAVGEKNQQKHLENIGICRVNGNRRLCRIRFWLYFVTSSLVLIGRWIIKFICTQENLKLWRSCWKCLWNCSALYITLSVIFPRKDCFETLFSLVRISSQRKGLPEARWINTLLRTCIIWWGCSCPHPVKSWTP